MKEFDAGYIDNELMQIGKRVKIPIDIYLIGGCAMSFRKLKETTKDIDIVLRNTHDYKAFTGALFGAQYYEPIKITIEYGRLEAMKMYENKDGFHLDLFVGKVCGKLEISEAMVKRAELHGRYRNLSVYLLSKEDVFLFKSLASEGRKRDLDDMKVIYPNLDWKAMKEELRSQKLSKDLIDLMISRLVEFREKFDLDVPILGSLKKLARNK